MLTYASLTHHIVPGPQSLSYFIPLILFPVALLIPRRILARWQSICLFLPLMVLCTLHAWIQMDGVDVISVDVLLWAFYLLVLTDPWREFRYVGMASREVDVVDAEDEDEDEVPEKGGLYPDTLYERVLWVGTLLTSIRLQGWTIGKRTHDLRQTSGYRGTTRSAFVRQAIISFVRGYIILDLTSAYQASDSYFTDLDISISSPLPFSESFDLFPPRLFRAAVMGVQVWALISQFIYLPCLILIALNALHYLSDDWSPHTWPPLYGDLKVILHRGVRGLWGQYWHQSMRVFTSAPGESISNVLKLGQRSVLRYALVTTIAFGLSGTIHVGLVPPEPLYASMEVNEIRLYVAGFFWLQAVAVVLEDLAVRGTSCVVSLDRFEAGLGRRLIVAVNLVWSVLWFSFCLPIFGEAARQLGYWRVWLVPISLWRGLQGQGWIAWG